MLKQLRARAKEAGKTTFYKRMVFPAVLNPQAQLAAVLFCFLLASYAGWSFISRVQDLLVWKEKIVAVETKLPLLESGPKREHDLLSAIQNAHPHYLEHHLGSLRLARLEAYSLEAAKDQLSEPQIDRLHFLMGKENTLRFIPGKAVKSAASQAVEMKQEHPVEVDEKDIQRILAHIEGLPIGPYAPSDHRPPMAIKKFTLKRKKDSQQRFPSYLLDIELWRREAVQNS